MTLRSAGNAIRLSALENICWSCSRRLNIAKDGSTRKLSSRPFSQTFGPRNAVAPRSSRLKTGYFLANGFLPASTRASASTVADDGGPSRTTTISSSSHAAATSSHVNQNQDLPHRRRQAAKRNAAAAATSAPGCVIGPDHVGKQAIGQLLPPPALPLPLALETAPVGPRGADRHVLLRPLPRSRLPLALDRPRHPVPVAADPRLPDDGHRPVLGLGQRPQHDLRARHRLQNVAHAQPTLVRGLLSQRKAIMFAVLAGATGVGALLFGVNPTVSFLGAANIVLYAGVYTPMKRMHWLNTWVGAIVGGIPPLMGWAAAAGESATGTGSFQELLLTRDAIGGWLMAALLFAWQFPHFMALSWSIREEYKAAGHQMLSWINPARNGRVALRYSLAFFPICFGLCAVGVTEWSFAATSLPVNVWLTREAVRFWRCDGFQGSAKGLFWASVWHLPVVIMLGLGQKKGMWGRIWRAIFGEPELEDEEDWEEDEADVKGAPIVSLPRERR
ncbi:protoheme IX farnesyltransferase [Apiospora phragmitis]|uniref:Heme O synthase n=1 Tax=Apiospora phragmitis TaxID=2905665 RepID=A0ABR1UZS1_9PEZI